MIVDKILFISKILISKIDRNLKDFYFQRHLIVNCHFYKASKIVYMINFIWKLSIPSFECVIYPLFT